MDTISDYREPKENRLVLTHTGQRVLNELQEEIKEENKEERKKKLPQTSSFSKYSHNDRTIKNN